MANELQSLSEIFQNRLFRIPDYQRGYAWQMPQLVDFWDDVMNLQEGRNHYTGLLSLKPLKRKDITSWGNDVWMVDKGYKACHIVDGQQRLTTFVVLINELVAFITETSEYKADPSSAVLGYDRLDAVREKYICQKRPPSNYITTYLFSYETDNPSAEYLRYKVFNEPNCGSVQETYYTKNLKAAKKFFADNLRALYEAEGLSGIDKLYLKLTQHLMFNIHEIDDDYDVFVAFETMNNRGKKLTNLELLKNRLIYLTTLYSDEICDETDKEHLRQQINDAWKEVYYQLGRNIRTPLSDDEYLRAHWLMYFKYTRNTGDAYIRFLLTKFSSKNIFEKKPVIEEDADSIDMPDDTVEATVEAAEVDDETDTGKLKPAEILRYVDSLKSLAKHWYDSYFPYEKNNDLTEDEQLYIDRLNRIGIGYFRPLVAAAISQQHISASDRVKLFKAIERFTFICFRLGGYNSTYSNSEYYRAARELLRGEKNIAEITKALNDSADANIPYAIPNFVTKVGRWFADGDGYYAWGKQLYYFLYEYEYSLYEGSGIKKITWEQFVKSEDNKTSIEHILPQKPTKYYWRNMFRQFNENEITAMTGALGNLLPLSLSINIALQNDSFDDKKHAKNDGRRGYDDGSHSELEVARLADWTPKTIYARTKKLIGFMETRWQLNLTEEWKNALIFVTFANEDRAEIPELPQSNLPAVASTTTRGDSSLSTTAELFRSWCEEMRNLGKIGFDPSHSNDSFIRFTTPAIDSILPPQEGSKSGWNCSNFYFYEIHNKRDRFNLQLMLSGVNIPAGAVKPMETLIDFYQPRKSKPDWEWKTLCSAKAVTYDTASSEADIIAALNEMFEQMMIKEQELDQFIKEANLK